MIEKPRTAAKQVEALGTFDINDNLQSKEFYTDLDGEWYFLRKHY